MWFGLKLPLSTLIQSFVTIQQNVKYLPYTQPTFLSAYSAFRKYSFLQFFLHYSLIPKLINCFPLINLHTMPHNDKEKNVFFF
jgi:hypothetical protein